MIGNVKTDTGEEEGERGAVAPLELSVQAHGSFSGVRRYLSLVQFMPYRVDIKKVQMNKISFDRPDTEEIEPTEWKAVYSFNVLQLK